MKNAESLFSELNNELRKHGQSMTIICVGGYVLQHYGIKETNDIDGFFDSTPKIDTIIRQVGEKFGVNNDGECWLNNSVQNLNCSPPKDICKPLHEFTNLKILAPPPEYIAGMKLRAGRERDIEDVTLIVKKLNLDNIDKFKKELAKYDFGSIDDSLIIEAFGRAYGMEWIENYYIDQEEYFLDSIAANSSDFYDDNNIA